MHLLSCSLPGRVVCWLPGSDEVLELTDGGLFAIATLDGVRRIAPARLIEQPHRRAIHDVVLTPAGTLIVLFDRDRRGPGLAEFDSGGKLLRRLETRLRIRMLLDANADRVRAVTSIGQIVEVSL
jgi:hypothetical protein